MVHGARAPRASAVRTPCGDQCGCTHTLAAREHTRHYDRNAEKASASLRNCMHDIATTEKKANITPLIASSMLCRVTSFVLKRMAGMATVPVKKKPARRGEVGH